MKIASITVFCDEHFRLESWHSYYQEYKNNIYLHIIINNGNEIDNLILKEKFTQSTILFLDSKSLTKSYNYGIKHALKDKSIDSIMLIGNDIKIDCLNLEKLHNFLFCYEKVGMSAPVLLKKDSNIIESYGTEINLKNLSLKSLYSGMNIDSNSKSHFFCDSVPGGMNLAKRMFYEKIGFQDENLFMYGDEIDIGLRAKKENFLFSTTIDSKAWHQHINKTENNVRNPIAGFLISRNSLYLAYKHFNFIFVLKCFFFWFRAAMRLNITSWFGKKSNDEKKYAFYYLIGAFFGLLKIKKIPLS